MLPEPPLQCLHDVLGYQPHPDAVGVGRRQDLILQLRLELLKLGFPQLPLERGRQEHEVRALRVGDCLQVPIIEGDHTGAAEDDDEEDGPRVLEPAVGSPAAEVMNLVPVDVVEPPSTDSGLEGRRR